MADHPSSNQNHYRPIGQRKAVCGTGLYDGAMTMDKPMVTCPRCRAELEKETPMPEETVPTFTEMDYIAYLLSQTTTPTRWWSTSAEQRQALLKRAEASFEHWAWEESHFQAGSIKGE